MERNSLAVRLIDLLLPAISHLKRHGPEGLATLHYLDTYTIQAVLEVWNVLRPLLEKNQTLDISLAAFAQNPEKHEERSHFRCALEEVLTLHPAEARHIQASLEKVCHRGTQSVRPDDALSPAGELPRRLEAMRLLHSGLDPSFIANRLHLPVAEIFRINYDFSIGAGGTVSAERPAVWLDQLDGKDPLLRRLEMVRLLRAGTPSTLVARQFDASEDYVLLIQKRFAEQGIPGIMTEDDIERFWSVHPREIRICSYNLQGVRKEGAFRFRRMSRELSAFRPDLLAFQEVVNGAGIEETSGQVAKWLSAMTGEHYRSHFTYCHQFMDRYPEGVAVCSRTPVNSTGSIDLTTRLPGGVRPSMDRFAQLVETTVRGLSIILVSVHLDHIGTHEVRTAQVEKLLTELDRMIDKDDYHALVLAGDFNDTEDSPALGMLKNAGFRDAYRSCHAAGGDTFAVPHPNTRIDYILVKGRADVISADVILNDPDLSDHLAVVAVLK